MKNHSTIGNNHQWSSKFGFLMAAVGSAVGLGNIWRFPYVASQYGGALFLIVYLVIVVVLGFCLMSAEIALGRHSQRSIIDTFKRGSKNWSFIGFGCLFICFLIVSYYSVIGGWLTKYLSEYLIGGKFFDTSNMQAAFNGFASSGVSPALFNFAFLFISVLVLVFGIKKGIEKVSKVLMPALFVMLVFVAVVALTMPNAAEGVKYFLVPNLSRIEGGFLGIVNAAMGQAFFSLSIGMGITCTYGSYLSKNSNIPKDSLTICGFDSLVAVIAGLAIIPTIFSTGTYPADAQGPTLIFVYLPEVFKQLGVFGNVVGFVFFLLIIFAALTSCISLLEVIIATIEQKFHLKRVWATVAVGAAVLVTSTLVSVSQDASVFKVDLLGLFDTATTKFLTPFTAFAMCIFIGFVWKITNAAAELSNGDPKRYKWIRIWEITVKYIVPLLILVIFVLGLIDKDGWDLASLLIALGVIVATCVISIFYRRRVLIEEMREKVIRERSGGYAEENVAAQQEEISNN